MSRVYQGTDVSGSFRVMLTVTTDMVEEARRIHGTSPLATAALGRVLTGTGLMALDLKNGDDRLTVRFRGDGPAGEIMAVGHADGDVKGYIADPAVDLPLTPAGKLDVGGSLGTGQLTVIKDLGLKEPYVSSIDLVSGEIAEDLTAYYYISEQQNTSFALGVKVDEYGRTACAGGMFIQMLPGALEGAVGALEAMLGELKSLTAVIERADGEADRAADIIFAGMPEEYRVFKLGEREMRWRCDCSRERLEQALVSMGEEDLREIIEEDGQAELTCQFCGSRYFFDKGELEKLLEAASNG